MSIFKGLFKVMFRRKGLVVSMIVTPLLSIMIMYAFIYTSNNTAAKIGIFDSDNSSQSRYIVEKLQKNKRYQLFENLNEEALNSYIQEQKLEAIVKIPKNFGDSVLKGKAEKLELLFNNDSEATAWIENDLNNIVDRLNIVGQSSVGNKNLYEEIIKDSNNDSITITDNALGDEFAGKKSVTRAVGILMIFLMGTTLVITEHIIIDKENGLSNRIKLAKSNFYSYFISFSLIGVIIVAVEIVIIQIGIFLLNINMGLSPLYYMLAISSFGFVCIGLSLLLGGACRYNLTAQTWVNIFNLPFAMLAGSLWPVELMPTFMQKISKFIPQNWTMSAITSMQLGNEGQYFKNIGMLFALAITLYVSAAIMMGRDRK